jgi:ABC-type polysaccharide/polyol phosphate export permease
VDSAVACVVLVGMMAYYGVWPGASILMLPVVLAVQIVFTAGLALLLSMGNLFYRDVKYLSEVMVTVWMFATSVIYPLDRLTGTSAKLLALNPMTHIIDAYRSVLLLGTMPDPIAFGTTALVSIVLLIGSWMLFHNAEYAFAENI